jgi:serine/threonine-protein kinase
VISNLTVRAYEARQLGQYRLVEEVGIGGMGEVWKAKHRMLVRPAAIKLIRPEMLGSSDPKMADTMLRRFEREAQATATLTSPHSVAIYDFGISDQGVFYYVMELLDGMDLYTIVSKFGPLPSSRVIELLRQACDSLADAHHRGLIHRDVKPGNLFACRMGRTLDFVKVLDFGLVKESARIESGDPGLTQLGTTTGTPGFMAPEQALGQTVDARSDLYSLGCVGYWLLTAQFVFDQTNNTAMILDHVKTSPLPPSQRSDREVPEDLERVIMRCLEKEPDKRPRTAVELLEMLEDCQDAGKWGQQEAKDWWDANLPQQL